MATLPATTIAGTLSMAQKFFQATLQVTTTVCIIFLEIKSIDKILPATMIACTP
jgi:hypothetical protein